MEYSRKEYISLEEYKSRLSRGTTEKGDLLFTTEAPMGNVAICDLDMCSCGQRIITLKPYIKKNIMPELYMYLMLSPFFQQQILDNSTGTTAKGIKAAKLKNLLIPLIPFQEQISILNILNKCIELIS